MARAAGRKARKGPAGRRGGRTKRPRTTHTTVRLSARVRAVLRAKARLWGCTQTDVITSAILAWRERWEPREPAATPSGGRRG